MNSNLERLKQEYNNIKASDELKSRIEQSIKQYRIDENIQPKKITRIYWFKRLMAVAACFCVICVAGLNTSETFAKFVSDIPGLETIVRVVTGNKYNFSKNGAELNIEIPEIKGLLDQELQTEINNDFKDLANVVTAEFEKDVEELSKAFPGEDVHMGTEIGYTVRTDTEDYLAIDSYIFNVVGSSSTVHKFITIDKHTKSVVTLESLFKDGSDYITPISKYIKEEIARQNASGENFFWDESNSMSDEFYFKEIKADQNFFINEDGNIVICFDKYEIAPGSSGSPEFVIPNDDVADILK